MADTPRVLPKTGERNVLITSALPYVNNVPHLGNIIGSVLSADVYSRFLELRGVNKLFVCGTDEYGTATETKAQQEGVTEQELCDRFYAIHKGVYDWFDVKFDHFHRTTTPLQTEIAQDIFHHCEKNGTIIEDEVKQLFCEGCSRFLADRYVAGECPLCQYDDAKGDQCDKCSQLINAVDLINPKCITCKSAPIVKTSKHLFLDLPQLTDKLQGFIQNRQDNWSDNSVTTTQAWLKTGLQPRCITRDLRWGTKVPREGYENKVFYVWFDAPIGYISITAGYFNQKELQEYNQGNVEVTFNKDWEKWWKDDKNVELVQFMGKDNVPFHTIIFPSTLLAANDHYTMLSRLSTTEYLNYEGTKFSKTRGVGVFGDQAKETGIPVEVWRYYLLVNRPENSDTMFTWDDFTSKVNGELPNTLGNLSQRVLAMIKRSFDGILPSLVPLAKRLSPLEYQLFADISSIYTSFVERMEDIKIKDSLRLAMKLANDGNFYMQETKPWERILKPEQLPGGAQADTTTSEQLENHHLAGAQLSFLVHVMYLVGLVFSPFMPSYTQKLFEQLNIPLPSPQDAPFRAFTEEQLASFRSYPFDTTTTTTEPGQIDGKSTTTTPSQKLLWEFRIDESNPEQLVYSHQPFFPFTDGKHTIGTPAVLFQKLLPLQVDELRRRFQGTSVTHEGAVDDSKKVPFACTIRLGKILDVRQHPNNERSYVLTVDVKDQVDGKPKLRQIVSGLVAAYSPEQLRNRYVVVMCNLKNSKFQGELSEGMLLTGINVTDSGSEIHLLDIQPNDIKADGNYDDLVGSLVLPTNAKHEPSKVFDPKKKMASLAFHVGDGGLVYCDGYKFIVNNEEAFQVIAPGVKPGSQIA